MFRFQSACGKTGKLVAARLLPGCDVIEGIEAVCREHGIKHAYVSCFGSFARAGYMYLVPNPQAKVGAGYGEVNRCDGPVEFLNGTGVVCQNAGNYDTHFHATMCDKDGRVFGGHLVKGENPALTTVDLVVIESESVQMLRTADEETGLTQFYPVAD
ncbi:conserved hypothetical protein [uncultured Eubacteriales bacterium]|uniref:PPC domain-containing protein n=1 Tax=uncultured Eubacteriales bacterium TaxID=172733 RepID=A0A212J7M6_9FIRM|nr:conserved hypothetical protein [uncultured Eubacteriales bacterium]